MSGFEFPTNIKQIGSIGEGLRIYIEDYAYTYLKQFAEAGGYEERVAHLIGRHMVVDGGRVLFISGAVQGAHTRREGGMTTFSEESMIHCRDRMEKYFRGLEIVGWMQSQPSYGTLLNSNYAAYHAATFLKPDQVLFVMDPIEDLNAFYTWSAEEDTLAEARGYFIYYDKNRGMQEYMLENRAKEKAGPSPAFRLMTRAAEKPGAEGGGEPSGGLEAPERAVRLKRLGAVEREDSDDVEEPGEDPREGERPAIPVSFVKPRIAGAPQPQDRRLTNLLVSLSAVLVLVCFIMGAGLIQSEGRITDLEDQLVLLTMSVRSVTSVNEGEKAESVFSVSQSRQGEARRETEEQGQTRQGQAQAAQAEQTERMPMPVPVPVLVSPTPTPSAVPAENAQPPAPLALGQALQEQSPQAQAEQAPQAQAPQPQAEQAPAIQESAARPAQSAAALNIPETYTVEMGDSLLYISQRFYGGSGMVARIMELNGIDDPNMLYVGSTIKLPRPETD